MDTKASLLQDELDRKVVEGYRLDKLKEMEDHLSNDIEIYSISLRKYTKLHEIV